MSLDKAIEHGKEFRKPYHKAGAADQTCRPGGSCPYCQGNRMYSDKKRDISSREQIKEAVHSVIHEGVVSEGSYGQTRNIMQALDLCSDLLDEVGNILEKSPADRRWFDAIHKAEHAISDVRNGANLALLKHEL
jgi:hypothetical protein